MLINYDYTPLLMDFNNNKKIKLQTILKIFENTGCKHSDAAKDNVIDSTNNGKAWILTDWYVKVFFYPKYTDKIKAVTWSEPLDSIFSSTRDFELYCNDELCAIATTRWAILDTQNLRPMKIEESLIEQYEPENKKTFDFVKIPKIPQPETFSTEKEIQIRKTDIDYNLHVHNLTYLDYAMELLPDDMINNNSFKNLHITYKLPVTIDSKITAKHELIENQHIICIYDDKNSLKTAIQLY